MSIRKYGEPRLTPVSLQMIEQAAGSWAKAAPAPGHAIARWFRPLVAYCNQRGGIWWRSVPRIGVGRARAVVACPSFSVIENGEYDGDGP